MSSDTPQADDAAEAPAPAPVPTPQEAALPDVAAGAVRSTVPAALGDAAESAPAGEARRVDGDALVELWARLVGRATALLQQPQAEGFSAAIDALDAELLPLIERDVDRVLLAALYTAGSSTERYCAAHALQVAISAHLAAKVLGGWDAPRLALLRRAAITMNIGMAELQDLLVQQEGPLTPEQRTAVDAHEAQGAQRLRELGVTDENWLGAVGQHHKVGAGAPEGRPPAEQMARLLQRVDRFTAAQSARGYHKSLGAAEAARAIYKDENDQPDAFGAATIKALGIYPPGALVKLANSEVAIVLRRGERADQPLVAALLRDNGMPHMTPKTRLTSEAETAITGALTQADMSMRLSLQALLELTA